MRRDGADSANSWGIPSLWRGQWTEQPRQGEREAAHAQAADSTTIAGQSSGRAPSGSGGVANSGSRARQAGNQQGRAGEGAPGNQTESLIIKNSGRLLFPQLLQFLITSRNRKHDSDGWNMRKRLKEECGR
uniref:Uncharacterized protein n=1 Tax=Oryza rufipogon TaxID=4529 RepID=A0A0E0QGY1_ORYRU